ncbi:MAG TPA: hypothetical protein VLV89_06105 [Candidatus Acidoferrum sp.]|nr:hypothetical protein [Candidatus Acidoferrum sp.]
MTLKTLTTLSKRSYILIGGAVLLAAAIAVGAAVSRDKSVPVTLADETPIQVTLNQALASNKNRPGDHFEATVSAPIVVDGKTIVPAGAQATGLVVDAERSGRLMGRARLELALESVDVNGVAYDIHTLDTGRKGGSHKKRNFALIGGGAGGGAIIGAIAGGGKGALIGGPVGAGAGVATAFITGKKDVRLPPETRLTFRLSQPVTITTKS